MTKMSVLLLLLLPLLLLPLLAPTNAHAEVTKETALMTKDLPDLPGKEGLVETVVLALGELIPAHRHNADAFACDPTRNASRLPCEEERHTANRGCEESQCCSHGAVTNAHM
jgi:hypothetical protein